MLLIDLPSIAARSFFATHYSTIGTEAAIFDSDIFINAFLKSLFNTLRILAGVVKPPIVLCVDSLSWRKKIYPEYKENRKDLKDSTPYYQYIDCFHEICAGMKMMLPVIIVKKDGYEADDLIAYFAMREIDLEETNISSDHITSGEPEPIMIVTTDKDMTQLSRPPLIQIFNPVDEKVLKVANTDEFLQVLVCTGDASDNIPSISPKNEKGKPKFQFGEKSIPKYYDPKGKCKLNEEFWKKLTKEEAESLK